MNKLTVAFSMLLVLFLYNSTTMNAQTGHTSTTLIAVPVETVPIDTTIDTIISIKKYKVNTDQSNAGTIYQYKTPIKKSYGLKYNQKTGKYNFIYYNVNNWNTKKVR
ncbi:hypothetical protein [Flammeovirga kamogawensis]|uniref:Uncharacterized protein n=1 Tax=Flammeovirga kamogawensis TaxID=373891 RepID=A0ABX8H4P6_9BACT|nr:hypothetical protein [Flammeovirga kamogawensis]MBB6461995.1 hypothetical protein [Flammeovirga kamogawensis]QWG10401.1 hypothetical protein KM029_25840 [Flammeovirga kamogawensis]TRX63911.1 hypothetical protein EO216_26215 [Flammeovirga kamogawensis]